MLAQQACAEVRAWQVTVLPGLWEAPDSVNLRWSRLSEQIFRVDKWSLCRG
jgi:hypothetical protein